MVSAPGVLKERGEQPPADTPRHAEVPGEDRRAGVESAVDVHLLVDGRPVARVLRRGRAGRLLHAVEDLTCQRATTRGVERQRRRRRFERLDEIGRERRRRRVAAHGLRRATRSSSSWSGLRTMLTSGTPSFEAELDQHLAEIRRRGRVHQGRMSFAAHGFQHSECGQRIDEGRCPVLGRCPLGQHQTCGSVDRSVLRVHRAAGDPHRLPEKGLRR